MASEEQARDYSRDFAAISAKRTQASGVGAFLVGCARQEIWSAVHRAHRILELQRAVSIGAPWPSFHWY